MNPQIVAVGSALPPNFYDQATLVDRLQREWSSRHFNTDRLRRLHENVLVGGRHLALPIEEYDRLEGWGDANDAWIRVALDVGETALSRGLSRAGLEPTDLDALVFVSVTGIATPSIDARLVHRMGLRSDLKRLPIFGLGCVAGAAGIARASEYLRGFPDQTIALLSVELCSLTLQREDLSVPNLIASGLFGDGAAAAILTGGEREEPRPGTGPQIRATRSVLYPDSEDVMGWRISEGGFKVILSAEVPQVVEEHLREDVDHFLTDHGIGRADIKSWVCHPGGPKVLEAMQSSLELPEGALDVTWRSLREVGNLSSTSVLMVLEETLDQHRPPPGSLGMLLAMGPGFCSELVLLEW